MCRANLPLQTPNPIADLLAVSALAIGPFHFVIQEARGGIRPFLDILQKQKLEGDTSQKTRKYGVKSGFDAVSAFEAAKVGSNFCRPAKAEQPLGIVLSSC